MGDEWKEYIFPIVFDTSYYYCPNVSQNRMRSGTNFTITHAAVS
jgi:hypothetical protein